MPRRCPTAIPRRDRGLYHLRAPRWTAPEHRLRYRLNPIKLCVLVRIAIDLVHPAAQIVPHRLGRLHGEVSFPKGHTEAVEPNVLVEVGTRSSVSP